MRALRCRPLPVPPSTPMMLMTKEDVGVLVDVVALVVDTVEIVRVVVEAGREDVDLRLSELAFDRCLVVFLFSSSSSSLVVDTNEQQQRKLLQTRKQQQS